MRTATEEAQIGRLTIKTIGSFDLCCKGVHQFDFLGDVRDRGHAHCVAAAIKYLSQTVLPLAIELDHKLQGEGKLPNLGFDAPRMPTIGDM